MMKTTANSPSSNDKILVAVIIAPHGINGALSAESYSDNPRRFCVGAQLLTENGTVMSISSASMHKGRLLLRFEGIEDRNSAEPLRGLKLYASAADVDPLPEGSYYYFQLIGLQVYEQDKHLGELRDVLNYAANDVYVVRPEQGREILIPALKSIVKKIDLDECRMEVELPEGLTE